jgi:hypothetical protein
MIKSFPMFCAVKRKRGLGVSSNGGSLIRNIPDTHFSFLAKKNYFVE